MMEDKREGKERDTHLYTTDILRSVRPRIRPLLLIMTVRSRYADLEVLEDAAEELEIRQLDSIDPNIIA